MIKMKKYRVTLHASFNSWSMVFSQHTSYHLTV